MKLLTTIAPAVLVALMGVSTPSSADDRLTLSDLSLGERVRLHLVSGGKTVNGTVETAGSDEVIVRPKDAAKPLFRFSPQQIEKLEVVRGRRSHWREGAVIGFVPGAVFMGLLVVALDDCYGNCDSNASGVALAGLVGGAVTGTVGGLIGLAVRSDRWTPVATRRPRIALGLAPAKGGFRANVSLGF